MGRVYDVRPDRSRGELGGRGWHCVIGGRRVVGVYRVELDADADAGPATVHAYFMNGGVALAAADKRGAVRVSFRHVVSMVCDPPADDDGDDADAPIYVEEPPHPEPARHA